MNRSFNWKQYLENYPDLVKVGINNENNAIKHWNKYGKNEYRTDKPLQQSIVVPVKQQVLPDIKQVVPKTQSVVQLNNNNKVLKIFLSTNVRDEDNIIEWIDYHSRIGFHTILVIDHLSKIPISEVIKNITFNCNVIIKRLEVDNDVIPTIKNYILKNLVIPFMIENNCDMFIHLDGDEYFNLKNSFPDVNSFVNYVGNYNQIGIRWLMFGSNYIDNNPTNNSLIHNYLRSTSGNEKFWDFIKCLVDPKKINLNSYNKNHVNPHFWELKTGYNSTYANKKLLYDIKINKATMPGTLINDLVNINHYYYQSWDSYIRRKKLRVRDDRPGDNHPNFTKEQFHKLYNSTFNNTLSLYYKKINNNNNNNNNVKNSIVF